MPLPDKGVENPRRAALADIVKSRNDQLVQEITDGGGDPAELGLPPETPVDDPKRPKDITIDDWSGMSDEEKGNAIKAAEEALASETAGQKAEREAKEAEAKAEEERRAAEAAAGGPKKLKIKVDGQEVEVDETAVLEAGVRTLQKETAADRRLEEATKARDEAERLRKAVEDTLARANPPAAAPKKSDQDLLLAKEGLRGIVKKIQYGSEEEAAEALVEYGNKMAEAGQSGRLTETELLNILDLREAQAFVKTNYADVLGDANLKELFVGKVNRKLAAGDARPYQEICKETGDELRAWRAPAKADPTQKGGSRAEAAQQRKTNTVSIPAAAVRQPAAAPETRPPSNADLVAKARESRGQS